MILEHLKNFTHSLTSYNASKTCKLIAFILAISLLIQISGFFYWFPQKKYLYYISLGLSFLYMFIGGVKFNLRIILFLIILYINVLLLPIDPIFKSGQRLLFYTVILYVFSPLLKTKKAIIFRHFLFKYLIIGLIPLVLGSLICFFLGINLMAYNRGELTDGQIEAFSDFEINGGLFSGLLIHSMILGPVAAILSIIFFAYYTKHKNNIWLVMFLISSFSVIVSASRSAVLALILPILYLLLKENNKFYYFRKFIIVGCLGMVFLSPYIERAATGIINKQKTRIEARNGKINSRDNKFQARINEFIESPILGIGFASIDKRYDVYNPSNGNIEPGTSHLAVLSMTGLFGFILYIIILSKAYYSVNYLRNYRGSILSGLFICFILHMFFEGYIFGSGSFLCAFFWLVISQCYEYKFVK